MSATPTYRRTLTMTTSEESPPLSQLYLTLLHNDLDVLGDQVIQSEGKRRLFHWEVFQQAYDAFPLNDVAHGRIYNRYRMCKIVVMATIAKELAQGNAVNEGIGEFPTAPLTEWGTDDWSALEEYVEGTAISLIRKDADWAANVKQNDAVDGRRGRSALYKQKLDKVLKYIKVHKALSPFRNVLSSQIDNEELDGGEFPKVDPKLVKEYSDKIEKEENEQIREVLLSMIIIQKGKRSEFRCLGELREMMKSRPFCFAVFDDRLNSVMRAWTEDAFEEPILKEVYFPEEEDENEDAAGAAQRLRHARTALNQQGEDPLDESLRLANGIGGSSTKKKRSIPGSARPERTSSHYSSPLHKRERGGILLKKRKTATRLEFGDSQEQVEQGADSDSEEVSEPDDGAVLSDLPKLAARANSDHSMSPKPRKSQQKTYKGRRVWSDEEKRAIKEGIKQIGVGQWAEIKKLYEVILNDRTSGQIKDCYRTMKQKGEFGDSRDDNE